METNGKSVWEIQMRHYNPFSRQKTSMIVNQIVTYIARAAMQSVYFLSRHFLARANFFSRDNDNRNAQHFPFGRGMAYHSSYSSKETYVYHTMSSLPHSDNTAVARRAEDSRASLVRTTRKFQMTSPTAFPSRILCQQCHL